MPMQGSKCSPFQFRQIKNTAGCPKCECKCPDVDCDAQCGGKGLGVAVKMNSSECIVCNRCRKTESEGEQLSDLVPENKITRRLFYLFSIADRSKEKRDWTVATVLSVHGAVVIFIIAPLLIFAK